MSRKSETDPRYQSSQASPLSEQQQQQQQQQHQHVAANKPARSPPHLLPTSPPQPSSEFQQLALPQHPAYNGGNNKNGDYDDDDDDDDGNSTAASSVKRKAPPESPVTQRPKKHPRSMSGKPGADDVMADDQYSDPGSFPFDSEGEANGYPAPDGTMVPATDMATIPSQESQDWKKTLDRVVKTVVAIRCCQPCSFDGEAAMASEASGFVVDAERGYILTNRHVVGPGPFWGYCIFENHEEVDVYPLYRDPIHDFGILRFDPKAIKYMKVEELRMAPEEIKVGTEIRVVGNDAGEKLSILQGVISRLDRNAPEYGFDGYNDFNTCYYQANASASGGSSGSPVVNKDGHAIALQAGGRGDASTDYFLPLDRPLRALKLIQEGKSIVRGDIQCQFLFKPFDECRRLGLPSHWEAEIRAAYPDATNMLVTDIVLPDGPSHTKIEEGDVLLKVNGELLTHFVRLDEILDSSVGGTVKVLVNRSGEDVEAEIPVGDLHAITPDRFITALGGAFQDLSYQQARNVAVAVKGVYVTETGGSWRLDGEGGIIIQSVDKKKTPDLQSFIEVVKTIPDKSRVVVTFKLLRDLHTLNTAIIHVDRHWTPKIRMAVRNDVSGLWDFTNLADPLPPLPMAPRSATFIEVENAPSQAIANLVRSFVQVECYMPMKLDGFPKSRRWGMGLVIDADKGLVLISRAVVPFDLCDITVTVADSIQVDAKVVFLHPLQNYTLIQYDPSLVDAPVLSANLSEESLSQGASINFVGFNRPTRMVHMPTTVTEIMTTAIPANPASPRYRALNVDAIMIDTSLGAQCGSGVLASTDGSIKAVWLTYMGERNASTGSDDEHHLGLGTKSLLPVLNQIKQGIIPKLRILSVEFRAVSMSKARVMGVPEEWIKRVAESNKTLHQLFMVSKRAFERGDQGGGLEEGDVILTFNGKIMSKVSDLDIMYDQEVLHALVVRDNEVIEIEARTVAADDVETDYAVLFCGALLHRPHHAVRQEISKLHSEIYISARARGSPAYQYGLGPTNFITHVNSKSTPDMPSFIAAVKDIPDNTYFRLRAVTFDSVPWVITLKKNDHYFPMIEWFKDPAESCGWRRVTHESGKIIEGEADDGVATAAMETMGGVVGEDGDANEEGDNNSNSVEIEMES